MPKIEKYGGIYYIKYRNIILWLYRPPYFKLYFLKGLILT